MESRTQQTDSLALDVDLQLMVFEAAIVACEQREYEQVRRALEVLRNFIDFEHSRPDIALGVLSIYRECGKAVTEQRLDDVSAWLSFLQELWASNLD